MRSLNSCLERETHQDPVPEPSIYSPVWQPFEDENAACFEAVCSVLTFALASLIRLINSSVAKDMRNVASFATIGISWRVEDCALAIHHDVPLYS
jgi:hypothetical protein